MNAPAENHAPIRRIVLYTGRVQGVGFRYTTCEVAADYQVTGCVKNLPDGRVEVAVEGTPDEVTRFVDAVARTMGRFIRDTKMTEAPADGSFHEFTVAY